MTIEESTQLLSKEASVELLADMLKQAEEDKTVLRKALQTARRDLRDYGAAPIQQVREEMKQALDAAKSPSSAGVGT